MITITLSAADAAAHIIENPFSPDWMSHPLTVTLLLVTALGGVFLRGFQEAIWLAVLLVAAYLVVNVIVIGWELIELARHPTALAAWRVNLFTQESHPVQMVIASVLLFPRLALGLSGFETGIAVMPLVASTGENSKERLQSRVANTRKLLTSAACIMSVLLLGSALVTTTMIPGEALVRGGPADGRALAFLAHRDFGDVFGTLYDLITIGTLWFAGASAMAGLLNLVPQYLPRYGMAPDWARANRPLVILITLIGAVVTVVFNADVNQQSGAYATGVLMLMTSAAVAVAIALPGSRWRFVPISIVFMYTAAVNIVRQPEGIQIAAWFIVTIVATSLISRVLRATELRIEGVDYDPVAARFVDEAAANREHLRIIPNRPDTGLAVEYERKFQDARRSHQLSPEEPVLFLEVKPGDASNFSDVLRVTGADVGGYRILRCSSPAIPNAIAGLLLNLRDRTRCLPHAYFGWTEGNPITYLLKFLAFGEGDTAPVCREVLRQAESDPEARPRVHVG